MARQPSVFVKCDGLRNLLANFFRVDGADVVLAVGKAEALAKNLTDGTIGVALLLHVEDGEARVVELGGVDEEVQGFEKPFGIGKGVVVTAPVQRFPVLQNGVDVSGIFEVNAGARSVPKVRWVGARRVIFGVVEAKRRAHAAPKRANVVAH